MRKKSALYRMLDRSGEGCKNKSMKRALPLIGMVFVLSACAPVLNRQLMKEGVRDVPLSAVRETPEAYTGKLFILGGIIIETKHTEGGSRIEALAVPVNRLGYLRDEVRARDGRFLALFPAERGFLDPLIYKKGRQVTLAGEFLELRKEKLDEIDYTYPVFEIRQIYLWEEYPDRYYYAPSYYYYPYPYWYDPWWRPYPPPWYGPYGPPPGW